MSWIRSEGSFRVYVDGKLTGEKFGATGNFYSLKAGAGGHHYVSTIRIVWFINLSILLATTHTDVYPRLVVDSIETIYFLPFFR